MIESNLKLIADNQGLFDAVKQVIMKKFTVDDLTLDTSNESIGEEVRAVLVGRKKVEEAFVEISTHKTIKDDDDSIMPSR